MIYHFGNIMRNVNKTGIWILDFANMMENESGISEFGLWKNDT
jgi:hypothetical protein